MCRLVHANYRPEPPAEHPVALTVLLRVQKRQEALRVTGRQEIRSTVNLLCGTHSLLPVLSHQVLMSKVAEMSLYPFAQKMRSLITAAQPSFTHQILLCSQATTFPLTEVRGHHHHPHLRMRE